MKYSELNEREKKAVKNIAAAASFLIGGFENELLDYPEGSEGYEWAAAKLADHNALVNELYDEAIRTIYVDGGCYFGEAAEIYLKDIRFCGKEWLLKVCDKRITKLGY